MLEALKNWHVPPVKPPPTDNIAPGGATHAFIDTEVARTKFPKALKAFCDGWPNSPSYEDKIRASGAYFVCPREFVLNYWQPRAGRSFDLNSRLMMDVGTSVHSLMQNCLLGPMRVLYGWWDNQDTSKSVQGFHPDPHLAIFEIIHQRPLTWVYREYQVWDAHYRISGHMDGSVSLSRMRWAVNHIKQWVADPTGILKWIESEPSGLMTHFELKTTSAYNMTKLNSHLDIPDYYKMQASVYQELGKFDSTLFWYISRDNMASQLITYPKEPNWWKQLTTKARIIWEAIRDETLPDTFMACRTPKDARAKECVFAKECWDRRLNFKKYVADGKDRARHEGRALLNLSTRAWAS